MKTPGLPASSSKTSASGTTSAGGTINPGDMPPARPALTALNRIDHPCWLLRFTGKAAVKCRASGVSSSVSEPRCLDANGALNVCPA